MVQEFRYATPGGLLVFFIVAGAYILDPDTIKNLGAFAGVLCVLTAIPLGWVVYQWLGFLTYRRGGLESYWETVVLRESWHKDLDTEVSIPFLNSVLTVSKDSLSKKLSELAGRYFVQLRRCFPKQEFVSNEYLSPLHDIIFSGQREHEYPRGQYAVHNTLTMIFYVAVWGGNLITISLIMSHPFLANFPKNFPTPVCLLIWVFIIEIGASLSILVMLLVKFIDNHDSLPDDHIIILLLMYTMGSALAFTGIKGYFLVVLTLLAYLFDKSTIPWRMLKVEAELKEELLTWLYQQWSEKKKPSI